MHVYAQVRLMREVTRLELESASDAGRGGVTAKKRRRNREVGGAVARPKVARIRKKKKMRPPPCPPDRGRQERHRRRRRIGGCEEAGRGVEARNEHAQRTAAVAPPRVAGSAPICYSPGTLRRQRASIETANEQLRCDIARLHRQH